jgi:predicted MFS family arabinose efflux permease
MQERSDFRLILVLGMMVFWCNGDNYAASPLIVDIARDLDLSISRAALSVTAYMLPFGLFTILFGPLADRFGKARIINIAAFGSAVFSALGALAFDLASLCAIRAVNGAFAAAILPVTMSYVGDRFGPEPRAVQNALGKVLGMMFLGGASATVIGGGVAYLASWRMVYLVYGIAELALALMMLRLLEKGPGTVYRLSLKAAYGDAFSHAHLLKIVGIIFLVGASVFGSFTYAGKFVETQTGSNILVVGLILTCFGVATVLAGRKAGVLRQRLGNRLFLLAGIIASVSWAFMGGWQSPVLLALSLAGFGLGFNLIQPNLVGAAQQCLPMQRGTVMSLASFNMFVGGGLGTYLNGQILNLGGYAAIFVLAALLILLAGALASLLFSRIMPLSSQGK